MKFRELPTKWKITTITLTALTLLFSAAIVMFGLFWGEYQKNNAAMRAPLKKADSERIGERFEIARGRKKSVTVNLYVPDNAEGTKLPLVINIHGGGFVGGDADVLDTQSDRIAKEWNAIVVSVDYTKADVNPIAYGSEEIKDTVLYFAENAEKYNVDTARIPNLPKGKTVCRKYEKCRDKS